MTSKEFSLCIAILTGLFFLLGVGTTQADDAEAPFRLLKMPDTNEVAGAPPDPSGLDYRIDGQLLTVTWNESPGAEGYRVSIGDAPGQYDYGTVDLPGSSGLGPVDVGPPGNGKTYYLAVAAYSASGVSNKSDEIAVKLPPSQAGTFSPEWIVRLLTDDFTGRLSGISLGTLIRLVPFIGIEPVMTFASLKRPELYTRIPGGILVDYGTAFYAMDGLVHSGSITVSFSNSYHSWGTISSGFSVVADNVRIDGAYLADGSLFGTVSAAYRNGTVQAAALFSGVFYSSDGPVYLQGDVSFDTAVCLDFPVSGKVESEQGGRSEILSFTPACDGSFVLEAQ